MLRMLYTRGIRVQKNGVNWAFLWRVQSTDKNQRMVAHMEEEAVRMVLRTRR
jgi:hypothetical protein